MSYGESCYVAAVLVRLGSIRLVLVRYGLVRLGGLGIVRCGKAGRGQVSQGGQGKVSSGSMGFGQLGHVMAVGERFGEVWSVELSLVKANLIL